jgi:prephenate dehydrogenase
MKRTVGIVGFGRFGQLLARILEKDYEVSVVEASPSLHDTAQSRGYRLIEQADLGGVDVIVLAVPISAIEQVIRTIAPYVRDEQVVMDICSVKVHPASLMRRGGYRVNSRGT